MTLVLCGINHQTAPINVRERCAFTSDKIQAAYQILLSQHSCKEAVIISTCNRSEIYAVVPDSFCLLQAFAKLTQMPEQELIPYCYIKTQEDAIRHLLRVATGLDSMMLGEPQIFGQIKAAYAQAKDNHAIKNKLKFIFPFIFKACKNIRHQSDIGRYPSSVAFAATQLIQNQFNTPIDIMLIGSGETTQLAAKYLKDSSHHFYVTSRTIENANSFAKTLRGEAFEITDLEQYLSKVDVVISATTCPLPFIHQKMMESIMQKRQHRPLFLVDLAMPRDIEADVALLPSVTLHNLDSLSNILNQHQTEKQNAATIAESMIDAAIEEYLNLIKVKEINHVIRQFRQLMNQTAIQELSRANLQLDNGLCERQVLSEFATRLINKLSHKPTLRLKEAAISGDEALLSLAQTFLTLEQQEHHEDLH